MPHIEVYASAEFHPDGRFGDIMEKLRDELPRLVAIVLRTDEPEGKLSPTDVPSPRLWPEAVTVDAATPHLEFTITANRTPLRAANCEAARKALQRSIWRAISRVVPPAALEAEIVPSPFRMGVGIRLPEGSYGEFCPTAYREQVPA